VCLVIHIASQNCIAAIQDRSKIRDHRTF